MPMLVSSACRAAALTPASVSRNSPSTSHRNVPDTETGTFAKRCISSISSRCASTCPRTTRPDDAPRSTAANALVTAPRPAPPKRPPAPGYRHLFGRTATGYAGVRSVRSDAAGGRPRRAPGRPRSGRAASPRRRRASWATPRLRSWQLLSPSTPLCDPLPPGWLAQERRRDAGVDRDVQTGRVRQVAAGQREHRVRDVLGQHFALEQRALRVVRAELFLGPAVDGGALSTPAACADARDADHAVR